MRNNTLRLAMLLTLCALVFMFALHAKTAVYNGGGPTKVTPITASKLWLSGQKMEVRSVETTNAVLFWIAALCLFGLLLEREPLFTQSAFVTPLPRDFCLRYVRRFLRPPPVQG